MCRGWLVASERCRTPGFHPCRSRWGPISDLLHHAHHPSHSFLEAVIYHQSARCGKYNSSCAVFYQAPCFSSACPLQLLLFVQAGLIKVSRCFYTGDFGAHEFKQVFIAICTFLCANPKASRKATRVPYQGSEIVDSCAADMLLKC
jgi:hypothetical protein